jgi:hypothetical protein
LYNILIEFSRRVLMKLGSLIWTKPVVKSVQQTFAWRISIRNNVKQGDALLPSFFGFPLDYAKKRKEGLKLNGTHQLRVPFLAGNINKQKPS